MNGVNELHRVCKELYSNNKLGLFARNMTLEDVNNSCNYKPATGEIRFAWYPADTPENELKDISIDGKKYIARKHQSAVTEDINFPRFYNWDDEDGVTHVSKDENDYIELKSYDKPVLTSKTESWYNPSERNETVSNILNGNEEYRSWLVDRRLALYNDKYIACFDIYTVCSNSVDGTFLYASSGWKDERVHGLRPVISFNINRLDISDTTKTGTETAPLEIK